MKLLLLGAGGREHALAWKICKSSQLEKLYVSPGNAGTSEIAENIAMDINDFDAVGNFCVQKKNRCLSCWSRAATSKWNSRLF